MISENSIVEEKLAKAIEKAASQLNTTYLRTKIKTVTTEYDEDVKKPVREETEEKEVFEKAKCDYDIAKLKTLTELWIKLKGEPEMTEDAGQNGGVVLIPYNS